MLTLGSLELPSSIICAPMAGCTNFTWRRMLRRFHKGLIYCEMVKMDALVRADHNTYRLLDYENSMHPIGAQICGSKPLLAAQSASMIEELGFDILDLNCGCPVDKVTKDGSGSGLLKNPDLIGEILYRMVQAVSIPITLKIRAGWDEDSINCEEIVAVAEQAGAKAVAIHGRTRAQGYKGFANWDWIKACKAKASSVKILANGDIVDAASAQAAFDKTGCDGILIARALLGRPWLLEDVERSLSGLQPLIRTADDYQSLLLEHLDDIEDYANGRAALIELRRIGCWYLRKVEGAKALRDALNKAQSVSEARSVILSYNWDEICFETLSTLPK